MKKASTKKKRVKEAAQASDDGDETASEKEPVASTAELSIWAPNVRLAAPMELASESTRPLPVGATRCWTPEEEYRRIGAVKGLRSRLVRLTTEHCGRESAKPPVLAFERWLSRAALRREQDPSIRVSVEEPLIPADGLVDEGLISDLARTLPPEGARAVATALAAEAVKAAKGVPALPAMTPAANAAEQAERIRAAAAEVRARARDTRQHSVRSGAVGAGVASGRGAEGVGGEAGGGGDNSAGQVERMTLLVAASQEMLHAARSGLAAARAAASAPGAPTEGAEKGGGGAGTSAASAPTAQGVVVVVRRCAAVLALGQRKPYLSISLAHYQKMRRLWGRFGGGGVGVGGGGGGDGGGGDGGGGGGRRSGDDDRFHDALFCLLSRYEALKGAGYQCALPAAAFASLRGALGPTLECFASPLNCHYERFCSAFGALEAPFGSLGSFFELDPREGSFEVRVESV